MIVHETRHFRLEAITLKGNSFTTWFLDRKEQENGHTCLVNVVNGTEGYCRSVMADLTHPESKSVGLRGQDTG